MRENVLVDDHHHDPPSIFVCLAFNGNRLHLAACHRHSRTQAAARDVIRQFGEIR